MSEEKPTIIYVQQSSTSSGAIAGGVFMGLVLFCGFPCWGSALLGVPSAIGDIATFTKESVAGGGAGRTERARERHEAAAKARREGTTPPAAPAEPAQPSDMSDPYEPGRQTPAPADPLNPTPPSQPSAHPSAPPSR